MKENDPVKLLKELQLTKELFVGIDSDGCAFDSIGIKQPGCRMVKKRGFDGLKVPIFEGNLGHFEKRGIYTSVDVPYEKLHTTIKEQNPAGGQPPNRGKTGFDPLNWERGPKNIFIIGHNTLLLKELKGIVACDFKLTPVILQDQPDGGAPTVIEKFEACMRECSYSLVLLTPDDRVERNDQVCFGPRPNMLFELGYACAKLGRKKILVLQQEGTDLTAFSDFAGVLCKRFKNHISEVIEQLRQEFLAAGLIKRRRNTLN